MVRDHVLASSGLLNREIGGPSVKPYSPGDIWIVATSGRGLLMNYIQDHGPALYRRGMYVFIKRTVPPPSMLMFDASNRDQCEVQRLSTNTPLQALIMLNDPHVLEASRVLAERLLLDGSTAVPEKVASAFHAIVCRPVTEEELDILVEAYLAEKTSFESDPQRTTSFLDIGEAPRLGYQNDIELAALMQTIHTIYNLEEAITKT